MTTCPVCDGRGEMAANHIVTTSTDHIYTRLGAIKPCPACHGGLPIYTGQTPVHLLHFRKVGA